MNEIVSLTRALADIESITGNEIAVANFLFDHLATLTTRTGGLVERRPVESGRFNVLATWGHPVVTMSTHMDTVPPFIPSREDDEYVWGRGACDAKGIIAAMTGAAGELLREGVRNFGLLFVVGEERNSAGAKAAASEPRGSRYLINGEPTENKLALGSKGALRFEITARGKMAHSAYPDLGESAIERLLDVLEGLRRTPLPEDPLLGKSTMNIGTIRGGRAPNVIADEAEAEIMVRLVGDPSPVRDAYAAAVRGKAELREVLCTPAMRFERVEGLATTVVSYTSDAPTLSRSWGKPLLIGPGSIHVAHTEEERISKKELAAAVGIYAGLVRTLQAMEASRPEARTA
ncbi:MAG TPA: M20/M25/M40 family metallo-hydrolase [Verrucomicrobiae bacterium]|nr:M20/M25/M40 family metallo-hydrolase [Verrucomicrobiae bacterium]